MRQLVQSLKILRTMSERLLAVAVLTAATSNFTTRLQADPGQGAIVTHIAPDHTGWYEAISPDGQLRLVMALTGQGDLFRLNPDGTLSLEIVEPNAPLTASFLGDNGEWVPMWDGNVSFHINDLVELADDGSFWSTFESFSFHVEGKLTDRSDGSKWSLQVAAVVVNYEIKVMKIDLQPR